MKSAHLPLLLFGYIHLYIHDMQQKGEQVSFMSQTKNNYEEYKLYAIRERRILGEIILSQKTSN